jgi:phosphoglucosamine mutase
MRLYISRTCKRRVLKQRADFGISLDGDGDRVILIDRDGNILDGDDLLYILAFANPNRIGQWSGVVRDSYEQPRL